MFTRHLSATQKGISMHSDPNADQLAFEVDGAPTPNESSAPSTSAVTEPSAPPSSSASALDTLLNEYRARATSEREKGTLFEELTRLRQSALIDVKSAMNAKLIELNDIATPDQQPPVLSFKQDGTTYTFESPDDKGSAVADKDLSLFDLAVFSLTPLPVIIHDSVLFNNIEKDVAGKLLELYKQSTKQVFITFDREQDYEGTSVEEIVKETSAITLGPDGKALYSWQWNKKTDEQEAEEQ